MVNYLIHTINSNLYSLSLFAASGLFFTLSVFFILRSRLVKAAQIPIDVFKSYVDSIISNAEAMKSSLINSANIQNPGVSVSTAGNDAIIVALQKEITALKAQLAEKGSGAAVPADVAKVQEENQKLKAELEKAKTAPAAAGANAADAEKLKALEAKLAEYEIIVEDLANLKEYKQENENLKKKITDLEKGGAQAPAPAPAAPAVEAKPAPAPEPAPAPAPAAPPPAAEAKAPEPAPAPTPEPAPSPAEKETQLDALVDKVEEKLDAAAKDTTESEEELSEQDKALLEEFEKMIGQEKEGEAPAPGAATKA